MDESSLSAAPTPTGWDRDLAIQREAVEACLQAGDVPGAARALDEISLLYRRRGDHSPSLFEFRAFLRLLIELLDDMWAPVDRTHITVDLVLYHEAREALVGLLIAFREPCNAGSAAEAIRRCNAIHDHILGLISTSGPGERRTA